MNDPQARMHSVRALKAVVLLVCDDVIGCVAGEDNAGPPYALLEHAPLAILTNGLLAAFNELRHCAPLSLCTSVSAILQVRNLFTGVHLVMYEQAESGFALHMQATLPQFHWHENLSKVDLVKAQ